MQVPGPDDVPRRRRAPAVLAGFALSIALGLALAGAAGRLRGLPPPSAAPAVAVGEGVASEGAQPGEGASAPAVAPAGVAVAAQGVVAPAKPVSRFSAITVRLGRNQTLAQALLKLDLTVGQVNAVVA